MAEKIIWLKNATPEQLFEILMSSRNTTIETDTGHYYMTFSNNEPEAPGMIFVNANNLYPLREGYNPVAWFCCYHAGDRLKVVINYADWPAAADYFAYLFDVISEAWPGAQIQPNGKEAAQDIKGSNPKLYLPKDKGGKRFYASNVFAYEEVRIKGRLPGEVYPEWRALRVKNKEPLETLSDQRDSFNKAIRPRKDRREITE